MSTALRLERLDALLRESAVDATDAAALLRDAERVRALVRAEAATPA
jgi:hypothetical protein